MNNSKSRNGGKALIVSPYLDHLGGGERYMLTCAQALETLGYEIFIGWDNLESIKGISKFLAIDLKNPVLDPKIKSLYHSAGPLEMFMATRSYDVVVYLSDGSIPMLGGRTNLLHMQVPFHNVDGRSWKNKLKLKTIKHIIVNSNFTKSIVDQEYGINSSVLYPPVPQNAKIQDKEKIILSVGRFEPSLNVKKQDILIEAFKKLSQDLPDWKLILVGGSVEASWIEKLRSMASGYNIELLPNTEYEKLIDLYGRASIYWHAAGYAVDQAKSPELVEHFGISTVEAISSHLIPLVYKAGGQIEIVKNPDLLWESEDELIIKTKNLTTKNFKDYEGFLDINGFTETAFTSSLSQLLWKKF